MAGLLDALGLSSPARGAARPAAGARPAGPDSIAEAMAAPPVNRADAAPPPQRDPRLDEIDAIIGDPEKRLKALADRKIPRYAAEYDADTPEIRFLKDLESGTKRAKEYVEFIQKASDYAQKFGDVTQSEQIRSAAANLKKVTSGVLGGLSQFADLVAKGQELVAFYQALDAFADASLALDMSDRASVTAWAKAIKTLWNAAAPFVDWLKSKALTAAFAGSKLAGVASATLSIVGAQIFVGIEALNAGLANVNLYIDKMKARDKLVDSGGVQERPPKPQPPAEWRSRGDEAFAARQREDQALRDTVYRQIDAEQAEARRKAEDARKAEEAQKKAEAAKKQAEAEAARRAEVEKQKEFRDAFFPKLYASKFRTALIARLRAAALREIRKNGWGSSPELDCYECFEMIGEEDLDGIPYPFQFPAARLGVDGAKREIACFGNLRTSCDDFEKVRLAAHAAWDRQQAAPAGAAGATGTRKPKT